MTASVMRAGKALVAEDVFNSPYLSPRIAAKYPVRSLLGLPLIAGDQKLGAALIAFNQPHHFGAEEIERGEQAARHIALAIARVKSFAQSQVQLTRLSTLYEIAHAMIGSTEIAPMLALVCRRAAELVSAPKSVLCAWDAADEHTIIAQYGLRDPARAQEEYTHQARAGVFDQAELKTRGRFGMNELPAQIDEMQEFVQREEIQSLAHAPLRVAQNQIGVLLDFDTQPRVWTRRRIASVGFVSASSRARFGQGAFVYGNANRVEFDDALVRLERTNAGRYDARRNRARRDGNIAR